MAITDRYDIVIGLEVHAQLATESKMFCGCRNRFGCEPNSNTCPTCLGMPGTLPVANRQAFDYALKAALAVGATIAKSTKFDRKHYFYPDLPKGYQISQYDEPYCTGGGIEILIEGEKKFIDLNRIHMEEDAGKLSHSEDSHIEDSLVDLNRAGTPLMEIVTEPVISSPEEAYAYLTELKQVLEYIEVSDCNMQEGSLRCDANISLKPKGTEKLGTKVEIKNLNSFRGVQTALEYEVKRQAMMLDDGETIVQETRLYDPNDGSTRSMRSKEEANDYRYFPEPDMPRFEISEAWIDEIRKSLCELPKDRKKRMEEQYAIPAYDVATLTAKKAVADYFEAAAKGVGNYKELSNWMMGEVLRELGDRKIEIPDFEITPDQLASLVMAIESKLVSKKIAKDSVFPEMIQCDDLAEVIIERKGLKVQADDSALKPIVDEAIKKNPKIIADVMAGKGKAAGALVGFVMKATKGKADPATVNKLIQEAIQEIGKR